MAVPWYEWRNVRERLITFGRAVQGVSPYRVVIEPDGCKCPSGYCSFARREIAANPRLFARTPEEQYQLTKAILVHEAGHRRFTTPANLTPVVHWVANVLEDERVEGQMCELFAGVRWLVRELARALYEESPTLDEGSDSPGQVVAHMLQLRWARRTGLPVKGGLSPENLERWHKVDPLVYGAWEAETSEVVHERAAEIVRLLSLEEPEIPQWVREIMDRLGPVEGERAEGDVAERTTVGRHGPRESKEGDEEPEPFDGDVPPHQGREGAGREAIEPQPYLQLEERVAPLATELIEELSWEERPDAPEPAERGGRFAMREYLRDRERPFLAEEGRLRAPPTLALKVIVDHSTSLNYRSGDRTRMESIAEAVMALHLVCLELGVRHQVLVTPQGLQIADLASGERGKALIAGLVPALCGYEDLGLALQTHALPMAGEPESIQLVLCLTDGACNDAELGKGVCRDLRGRVEVIGVLLDPDEYTREYVSDMFGEDRVIGCRSVELPRKLGNILRAIRGV